MSAQQHLGEGAGSVVPLPGLDMLGELEGMTAGDLTGSSDFGEPLPDIIELAPEIPVGVHLWPIHTSHEIGVWMAGKAVAAQIAERRLYE